MVNINNTQQAYLGGRMAANQPNGANKSEATVDVKATAPKPESRSVQEIQEEHATNWIVDLGRSILKTGSKYLTFAGLGFAGLGHLLLGYIISVPALIFTAPFALAWLFTPSGKEEEAKKASFEKVMTALHNWRNEPQRLETEPEKFNNLFEKIITNMNDFTNEQLKKIVESLEKAPSIPKKVMKSMLGTPLHNKITQAQETLDKLIKEIRSKIPGQVPEPKTE